jgi:trigger factor
MKVTQEKLPASQICLEIEISAETSQNTYEKVVQNLARTVNIPGFRKGKAPRQILLQRLGVQRVKAAVLEEIIQKGLEEAIKQEAIEILGNSELRSDFEELVEHYKPGEAFTFSATVDVPPSVELGDYKNLKITAEESTYDPQDVEDFLEKRRAELATFIPVEDRPAQMGDVAIIDYQGYFLNEEEEEIEDAIPGVEGTDFQVEMAEGRFIEGMIEGIVGMKPEETKDLDLTFPEDYDYEHLAGELVRFTITLKELKEKELPELNDDFAEEASEFETMAELRESLEKQFQEKAAKETKNNIHEAILDELVNISFLDLPETMIQKEVDLILTQTAMQMERIGVDLRQLFTSETIPKMRETARPDAIESIVRSLIIQEIAKIEAIEADAEAIATRIKEVREQLSDRDLDLERLQSVVEEEILKEKVLDWLQEKATVELVPEGSLEESEETEETEESASEESATEEE